MQSEIKTFTYPNGEIQRVQVVRWDDWSRLDFLHPDYSEAALDRFTNIYRLFLVPAHPWLFGTIILFRLPEELDVPVPRETRKHGILGDDLTAAAAALRRGVKYGRGKKSSSNPGGFRPCFLTSEAQALWQALETQDCLRVVQGKLPTITFIPIGREPGYLTQSAPDAALKANASFFIMDMFDCATVYDHVGTPLGLCVKDGVVENPPLFGREALLARRDGSVVIASPDLREMTLEIGGHRYHHGENAALYSRPEQAKTPRHSGKKLVIIGRQVAAVSTEPRVPIPASGFVLCVDENCTARPGDLVTYQGLEDVIFGIQVGNSILRDGVKTDHFISQFYNIYKLERVPYPPCLYPMDFANARAARIALGADAAGKPMLLWAEGAGKLDYQPGRDSRGASLTDMAEICSAVGMYNAINLDGGGSAQILINNQRSLLISDRNRPDNDEAERPVPLGLVVR